MKKKDAEIEIEIIIIIGDYEVLIFEGHEGPEKDTLSNHRFLAIDG